MSTNSTNGQQAGTSGKKQTAGAYDVRVVIGGLLGLFGIVLVIMGLVNNSASDLAKAGGENANLWTGIAMVVVAVAFGLWTWLRPIVVDPAATDDADELGAVNH